MRIFDLFCFKYNRTDFHELNLDWIISDLRTLAETLENFINLNTIKYANPIQWNISTQYEANTVIVDANTGTAYLSVKPVPSGVALSNTDYWTPIFTLDFLSANQNITLRDDGQNILATFTSAVDDWLIWQGLLYKVTQNININEAYVPGYNITRYTVEQFLSDAVSTLNGLITTLSDNVGDIANLTTPDTSNVVNAINSVDSIVNLHANEIDEIKKKNYWITPEEYGAVGDGVTDDTVAIQKMFDECEPRATIVFSKPRYLCTGPIVIGEDKHNLKITGGFDKSEYTPSIYTSMGSGNFITIKSAGVGIQNLCIQGTIKHNSVTLLTFDSDNSTSQVNTDAIINMCALFSSKKGLVCNGRNVNISNSVLSTLEIGVELDTTAYSGEENRGFHILNNRFHDVDLCVSNNIDNVNVKHSVIITNNFADISMQLFRGNDGGLFIANNIIDTIGGGDGTMSGAIMVEILKSSHLDNVQRTVISNNKLIGWANRHIAGIMIEENNVTDIIVKDNVITNVQGFGIGIKANSKAVIIGNVLTNCGMSSGYYAINPLSTASGAIANNVLVGCTNTIRTGSAMTEQNNINY